MVKINAERAPQVLKIDHDDAISLSGESDVDSDEEFSPLREEEDNLTSNDILLDSGFFLSPDSVPVSHLS